MATRKRTARRAHVDRHGGQAPTVEATALCEGGRHDACKGEIVSLLAAPGTPCGCRCHARKGVAA